MIVNAMYPSATRPFSLQIQPASIDSLEPTYFCAAANTLASNYSVGSKNLAWTTHLNASSKLYASLDAISGVSPSDNGFHQSWDHYYDNLSARQCHAKPLPCNISTPSLCVTQEQANEVYRLGQYEYSYIYRGAPESLQYATASYGVWLAELAQNIRDRASGKNKVKYRHNVAHDGSVSRLLAILQLDVMVWPGMGSEVVFEVYKKHSASDSRRFVRVLWGGKVLRSSNPSLGLLDMVDADILLGYVDALAGTGASKVIGLCKGT
jgi:acid phosphatase